MIVITGATGKIGAATAGGLIDKGVQVKLIGRNAGTLSGLQNPGAEIAVGAMTDANFLTEAFCNATAVLLMLPPDKATTDFGAFQDAVGEAQVKALQNTGVKNVIFISSQGAHDIVHTGTVKGLGRQEIRLNSLPADVNVISLRPAAFMENCMESLRLFNSIATPLRPDIITGLVATRDIADFAVQQLLSLSFKGKTHQDLLGNRDYAQTEIAEIVGRALGKPALQYTQYTYEAYKNHC